MACGTLVPWQGSKPVPPAVEVWSLSHWIIKKVPPKLLMSRVQGLLSFLCTVTPYSSSLLLWGRFVILYRRQWSRLSPRKGNAKRQNGCLRRPYKELRKEEKWKAKEKRKDIPIWMQRIARRYKKAFLSDQCKEIEENNRMGKTRDLFKKIRDAKEPFHSRMARIKDKWYRPNRSRKY